MSTAAPDTIPALFDGFLKSVTSSPVDVAGGAAKVLPGAGPPPPPPLLLFFFSQINRERFGFHYNYLILFISL